MNGNSIILFKNGVVNSVMRSLRRVDKQKEKSGFRMMRDSSLTLFYVGLR